MDKMLLNIWSVYLSIA